MPELQDHSERIAQIQAILRTGAKRVTTDGTSVEYDLDSLRAELRQLMAEDETHHGRRPTISTINISGAF